MANSLIQLDESLLIGKGLHRFCYQHPKNPALCIKVSLDNSSRSLKEINRELRYYRFLEKQKDSSNLDSILPRYHGPVQTSKGEGHIFDLVLDADGRVAKPLSYYLRNEAALDKYGDIIRDAYLRFREKASQGNLITMALKPYNILLQAKGNEEYELVLIDSLGSANLIPGAYLSRNLAKAKIRRHLTRFEHLLIGRFDFDIAPADIGTAVVSNSCG
ncbi:YrbL family protein [Marinobacterium lutimaris]|uniref:PhoP regulatory network protein YrbL n=1 Tax=Marinobacterium lutimaris TaxID=568106 RepID=A0A1H6AS93_9GAMM|nr:YrbL family protein [Marinobacterium lutimaris]SEG51538.1 PhoP regulatory network protein YrbL [Marinobacterium lutimaris]